MSHTRSAAENRPDLQVAIDTGSGSLRWNGSVVTGQEVRRMRCPELREAIRERTNQRDDWISAGKHPVDLVMALEIDVLIADDAAAARADLLRLGESKTGDTVRYIGTSTGLATLILDIYVADVADAVILRPLDIGAGESLSVNLIVEKVLPLIRQRSIAA